MEHTTTLPFTQWVTSTLAELGHQQPAGWQNGLESDASSEQISEAMRIYLINRQLRLVVGSKVAGAINVRCAILDMQDPEEWMRVLRERVLPFIAEHQLTRG